jgi:hypothetical protein
MGLPRAIPVVGWLRNADAELTWQAHAVFRLV